MAVITKVWVAYASWPNEEPYAHVVSVLADTGVSPQHAALTVPLSEGDRVWMTYTNDTANLEITNWTFGMYATGM